MAWLQAQGRGRDPDVWLQAQGRGRDPDVWLLGGVAVYFEVMPIPDTDTVSAPNGSQFLPLSSCFFMGGGGGGGSFRQK